MRIPDIFTLGSLLVSAVAAAPSGGRPFFYKGHDLSSLRILEDSGTIYKDTARNNATRPVEDILGDGGMNTVRLRLWVDPLDGSYNLAYTLDLAKRFHDKGYRIYLDYHFSDTWADPQHNNAPAAWPTTLDGLTSTLRSYVNSTLLAFTDAGIDLSLVSLGNEIRHGMLWPLGYVDVDTQSAAARTANFTQLAALWAAARGGVDDAVAVGVSKPEIMVHIDNGWNATLQEAWFDALTGSGIASSKDWDVLGFSFYPFYGTAATFDNLQKTLDAVAEKYGKPVHVVETDYPVQCDGADAPALSEPEVPVSAEGQLEWVREVIDVVRKVPKGLGQGVHYWEPAWLNSTSLGSSCQDAILFDADWSLWPKSTGYSRKSVDMFKY
ncbi:glycoside hydrolase family 53 protein [Aplosporella prunicola CBS 121167]|uniref:Arabinogalactan endo-beta-1,4-galactanase n=1 Tax=Aplosporella prunicola CBS 121167 TaxID=1176127 RepID=A0A6A6B4B9_9PEZI|nr:glycoside hydrolase family 53 protein [Aplosporella prunicola CBS 121167]KAF2137601.1 glycoside hydrolase family 53 protein [Aplosporella prunicola CBS 121167]